MKTSFHIFFSSLDTLDVALCGLHLLEAWCSSGHGAHTPFRHASLEQPLNLVRNLAVQVWVIDG